MRRSILTIIMIGNSICINAQPPIPPYENKKVITTVINEYPDQLSNPEKKTRKTFSQFGYGLSEFTVPVFPISKFIQRDKYGSQSYGKPDRSKEKNGAIYTCRGGFIDFSHMRQALDWTVYLSFKLLEGGHDVQLPQEAGKLDLQFSNLGELTQYDLVCLAQKIAFERLTWHEVASWHYHKPYHLFSEQQSTFTPEDNYSNFLGTVIGRNVMLRILSDDDALPYSQIATEEIKKMLDQLQPVASKAHSRIAYDIVDRNKQMKLPPDQRNNDVWYDSKIVFRDQRHIFKRNLNIGPQLQPWLVPHAEQTGCPRYAIPEVLHVPQVTQAGTSLYHYYTFTITPDSDLFYDRRHGRQKHPPFSSFTTDNMPAVIAHIRKQMEGVLTAGFDKRDNCDPTIYFTNARKVMFK